MALALPETAPSASLIEDLLHEQSSLPAVEAFSRWHDKRQNAAGRYAARLPTSQPGTGQQYAFEVNLDACTGCKACVVACHSLNGLGENESWRATGEIVSTDWRHPLRQTVTTACHHCVEPACATGCPTLAYEKDARTGIVRHLDDQCIGCRYCTMTCPYEVPQFEKSRGIVRKCDMCRQRLEVGEAPACVQACPNGAIRIVLVEKETLRRDAAGSALLPTAPGSSLTVPSTRFSSAAPLPATLASDNGDLRPADPHVPLVFMLVLTQWGVGCLTAAWLLEHSGLALAGASLGIVGGAVAVLHLGRPWQAWRAWLGWRQSWLSREIILFGLHGPLALLFALTMNPLLGAAAVATGVAGVVASGMLYHATRREWWRGGRSVGRFLLTAAVLGGVTAWAMGMVPGWLAALCATVKLAAECRWQRVADVDVAEQPHHVSVTGEWSLARSVRLLTEWFGVANRSRLFLLLLCGVILPLSATGSVTAWAAAGLCVVAELLERMLFFRAAAAPVMPGWNLNETK